MILIGVSGSIKFQLLFIHKNGLSQWQKKNSLMAPHACPASPPKIKYNTLINNFPTSTVVSQTTRTLTGSKKKNKNTNSRENFLLGERAAPAATIGATIMLDMKLDEAHWLLTTRICPGRESQEQQTKAKTKSKLASVSCCCQASYLFLLFHPAFSWVHSRFKSQQGCSTAISKFLLFSTRPRGTLFAI